MPEYLLYLLLVFLVLTSPSPSFVREDRNHSQKPLILFELLLDLLLLELRVRARRLLPTIRCSLHILHCFFDQRLRRIRVLSVRFKPLLAWSPARSVPPFLLSVTVLSSFSFLSPSSPLSLPVLLLCYVVLEILVAVPVSFLHFPPMDAVPWIPDVSESSPFTRPRREWGPGVWKWG